MEIPENLSKSRKSPENPHVFRSLPWFQRPPAPFFAFLQGRAPRVAFHHRGCGRGGHGAQGKGHGCLSGGRYGNQEGNCLIESSTNI